MNIPFFIVLLFMLQAVCFIAGWLSARFEKGRIGYFLVSKRLTFLPLTMTLIATLIGGGTTLGAAEEAYVHGWIIFLYPLGGSLGFILLALGLGRRMAKFKVSTVAEIMEVTYKSIVLKKIASLLSMISLTSILIGQVIATKKFMFSLGVGNEVIFIGFWAIVIFYTALGGLRAVATTDIIQGFFFIGALLLTLGIMHSQINFGQLSGKFQEAHYDWNKFSAWLLMPMLYMVIEQDVGQRCFASRSARIFSLSALTAAVASLIIGFIPVCLGMAAHSLNIPVPVGSSVLICAMTHLTNPVISAIGATAIIAAIISTADSEINAISSNLSQDFTKDLKLGSIKMLTACVAVFAIFCSYLFDNVIPLIIVSFEFTVYCLFVPIVMALFKTKHNKLSAILSIFCGGGAFIILKLSGFSSFPHPLIALPASLIGFGLGGLKDS